jgi:hypothetical protein
MMYWFSLVDVTRITAATLCAVQGGVPTRALEPEFRVL